MFRRNKTKVLKWISVGVPASACLKIHAPHSSFYRIAIIDRDRTWNYDAAKDKVNRKGEWGLPSPS